MSRPGGPTRIGPVVTSVALHRFIPEGPFEDGFGSREDPFGAGRVTWPRRRWTGPEQEIGFPARELVASWIARTPPGSWLEVELRARTEGGELTRWYCMGRWAEHDGDIHRTSLPGQGDGHADVAVDTLVARQPLTAYRIRLTMYGEAARVDLVSVMASATLPRTIEPSPPTTAARLDVPPFSQKAHTGHHPQWDGGGQNWCSPTSVAMVLAYWGVGPAADELGWVGGDDPRPQVDHAARGMYDHSYQGTGNWPFSLAYAGRYGLTGCVTRLRSLAELERFIDAGIPVITSQSFKSCELPGAGYSTTGHILVVTGFTEAGDVVVNDPAAPDDSEVIRVYPRAAFDHVWRRSSGSGGIAYVIHPPGVDLPPTDGNW